MPLNFEKQKRWFPLDLFQSTPRLVRLHTSIVTIHRKFFPGIRNEARYPPCCFFVLNFPGLQCRQKLSQASHFPACFWTRHLLPPRRLDRSERGPTLALLVIYPGWGLCTR